MVVGGQDAVVDQVRRDGERFVVRCFACLNGALRHLPQCLLLVRGQAELGQRCRQPNASTESGHFSKFSGGAALDDELYEESERHLLAVHVLVGFWCSRQTVVQRVSDCQSAGFKSQTRKQGVGLDYSFQCWSHRIDLDISRSGQSVS